MSALDQLKSQGPSQGDTLKLVIVRENKKIESYRVVDKLTMMISGDDLDNETVDMRLDGVVWEESADLGLAYAGTSSQIFIQNETIYTKMPDGWVVERLDDQELYFVLAREISLLQVSDVGILEEDPLDIIVSMHKEQLGKRMAQELLEDLEEYTIDYETALNIEATYTLTDDLFIQNIRYDGELILDSTTVSKNGIPFAGKRSMLIDGQTTFAHFNRVQEISVPQTVVQNAVSASSYASMVNQTATAPTVPDTNVTIPTNTTGNGTGNETGNSTV